MRRHEPADGWRGDRVIAADDHRHETIAQRQRVSNSGLDIAARNADRCVVISAEQDEEKLEAAIWDVVSSRFPELQAGPVA